MKILLVDDDSCILELFGDLISYTRPDIEVLKASNGLDALELVNVYKNSLSVILSDLKMSPMDGFAFKKALNHRGIKIPLVFVSAMPTVGYKLIGKQLGAIGFLSKPLGAKDLIDAIERAVAYSQIVSSKPELLQAVAELVISQTGMQPIEKQLSEDYTIGRTEDSDIRLISNKASREHAVLNRTVESYSQENPEHHYRLIDLSRNGFFVNGRKVSGYYLLKHSDYIEFPECTCKYFVLDRDPLANPGGTYS